MSAGHGHKRPNLKHHSELAKLKQEGGYADLWKRWQNLDNQYDIPDLAGYNVDGTIRYIDRDFFHALFDPNYARHLGLPPIDTGLSPENTIICLIEHEGTEKVLLDADNEINDYESAHELSTCDEHQRVRQLGGKPVQYERGLEPAIKWCEKKALHKVPPDLACAPYVDDPDANDKHALKQLKALGVEDADKVSKKSVHYRAADGDERCDNCSMWQPDPQQAQDGLARCSLVDGLVRDHWLCDRHEPQEASDGKIDSGATEEDSEQGLRPARQGRGPAG